MVITEQVSINDQPIQAILNSESIGHSIAKLFPDTTLYTAAVRGDAYDSQVAALISRARALITVVHPDPHLNAGLAYATLLPPSSQLLVVKSSSFGPYPLSPAAYENGLFTDLELGAGIRCAFCQLTSSEFIVTRLLSRAMPVHIPGRPNAPARAFLQGVQVGVGGRHETRG